MFTAIITSTLFWQFVILNFINVLVNTARSLTTVKGGKWVASFMNALCYGYYTIIIVITATYEMPLIMKCIAVAIVNFIGVFTVKFCEEKIQKEKLWVYNVIGISQYIFETLDICFENSDIKFEFSEIEKDFYTMQIFSETQKESEMIKSILNNYNIKYYAVEVIEKNKKGEK